MSPTSERLHEPRDRQARAARILDVTAELLLRHGYRRVTIDDIARHADIGKGTVYLHWKTRDDLFKAVFEREVLHALTELLRRRHAAHAAKLAAAGMARFDSTSSAVCRSATSRSGFPGAPGTLVPWVPCLTSLSR